jgi:hypothetical protein
VNHLAEQVDPLVLVFLECLVALFNGIFHAVAKAKMTGQNKLYRPEIQEGGRKVLFPEVLCLTEFFYPAA